VVEDLSSRMLDRLGTKIRRWNQGLQNLPLFVSQVGRVGFPYAGFHAWKDARKYPKTPQRALRASSSAVLVLAMDRVQGDGPPRTIGSVVRELI
jgi:hypothetical protein